MATTPRRSTTMNRRSGSTNRASTAGDWMNQLHRSTSITLQIEDDNGLKHTVQLPQTAIRNLRTSGQIVIDHTMLRSLGPIVRQKYATTEKAAA